MAEQPEEPAKKAEGEEQAPQAEEKKAEEPEDPEAQIDFEGLDPLGVDEVKDIGAGVPLFKEFQLEDWTVMSLAFELHLMAHAFGKDVGDPERQGIHLDHLQFYYHKYYKKPLNLQMYGVSSTKELLSLGMLRDVVYATEQSILRSVLDEEWASFQVFVKLAEESRRYRNIRVDFGDESEALKIQMVATREQWASQQRGAPQQQASWQPAVQTQGTWQQQQGKPWQSGRSDWQGFGKAQGKGGKDWNKSQPYNRTWNTQGKGLLRPQGADLRA